MAEFVYNNVKIVSTGHILFELNCGYYPWILYKKDIDLCFWSKTADKLLAKLWELIIICQENFCYAQKV